MYRPYSKKNLLRIVELEKKVFVVSAAHIENVTDAVVAQCEYNSPVRTRWHVEL